ncbi:MAG: tryptophan--tRNA ligase [Candidatus Saganbacteria bacterium]|nr:tryptophan--tRNA ligase [Candidatus Saganbacteria bacterium]
MKKKRILSGIQPSGKLHLGNWVGALQNWVKLQDDYDCFFFIADLHALTTTYEDTSNLKKDIRDVAIDLLSVGIDPKRSTLFIQSDLPEHSELHLIFSMITPLPWLERVPTYKSKIEEIKGKDLGTYGFLGYPVLQAADILIYKAECVPVGQDQLPHLELTREICRRFNNLYKPIFPEPNALLTQVPVMVGLDGRKMSKSYGNTIPISDSPDALAKKIQTMFTDPKKVKKDDPGHPDGCAVFAYHEVFNKAEVKNIKEQCKAGGIGCVACKKQLAEILIAALAPIHERRSVFEKDIHQVEKILIDGAERARAVASVTLKEVKEAMGFLWV